MSRCVDVDSDDRALAGELHQLRRQVHAVGRPQEQQHCGAGAVGAHLQAHLVAGGVFALVGHDFDVVEAEARAVEALAADREHLARLRFFCRPCRPRRFA